MREMVGVVIMSNGGAIDIYRCLRVANGVLTYTWVITYRKAHPTQVMYYFLGLLMETLRNLPNYYEYLLSDKETESLIQQTNAPTECTDWLDRFVIFRGTPVWSRYQDILCLYL